MESSMRRVPLRVVRSMATVFFFGLVALAMAPATPAEAKSTIVWSRFEPTGSRAQLVAANPDGSMLRKLTHPSKHTQDIDPSISPDGSEVAFERDLNDGEFTQIDLVEASGEDEHALDLGCVDPCAADLSPTWLPMGDRIAFTRVVGPFDLPHHSAHAAALQTAMTNGSDVQRLSEDGIDGEFEDYHARYSLDGSYVVFNRVSLAGKGIALFRMDPDGSDVRRLTPWTLDADLPDLSLAKSGPTQDLIVFETYGMGPPHGKSQDIATVPATCAPVSDCRDEIRYVTHNGNGPVQSFNPSWSPNGGRIAYVKFNSHPFMGDIWVARPDGSHRRAVSRSPLFEFRPDWGEAPPG
jgi:Tol biopolymer transport system component